jgi:hypothetical protein
MSLCYSVIRTGETRVKCFRHFSRHICAANPHFYFSTLSTTTAQIPQACTHIHTTMTAPASFLGYKWTGLDTVAEGTEDHQRVGSFFDSINWDALCRYASELHDGESCTLDPQLAMGGAHLIRIIVFDNGTRWIARLRMHLSDEDDDVVADGPTLLQIEVDCMQLVRARTSVPVPAVYGYMTSAENDIGTPFMLMECLAGNVAMNLSMDIPPQHKSLFYADMAGFQVSDLLIQKPDVLL